MQRKIISGFITTNPVALAYRQMKNPGSPEHQVDIVIGAVKPQLRPESNPIPMMPHYGSFHTHGDVEGHHARMLTYKPRAGDDAQQGNFLQQMEQSASGQG